MSNDNESPMHDDNCTTIHFSNGVCSCGLDELKAKAAKWDAWSVEGTVVVKSAELSALEANAARFRKIAAAVERYADVRIHALTDYGIAVDCGHRDRRPRGPSTTEETLAAAVDAMPEAK